MTTEEYKQAALKTLRQELQPDVPPVVGETELKQLLEEHQVASLWAPGQVFIAGQIVMPNTPNLCRYKCVRTGTSGATEPVWPEWQNGRVTDGTVQWQHDGPAFKNLFDVPSALHAGYKLKMVKAAALFDTDDSMSQVFQQYEALVKRSKPWRVA